MKHVSVWNIETITRGPLGPVVVYATDGDNQAVCEPSSHALISWGDRICPSCYPASYPTVARHRKDAS